MEKVKRVLNKKLIPILIVALALLGGAIWLNITLNENKSTDILGSEDTSGDGEQDVTTGTFNSNVSVYSDYFSAFRSERSAVRAQEIEYLRSIINSENADADMLAEAQQRLLELVSNMEKEFTIESRIRSKGFLDAAVTFQGDSITVIVEGESLTDVEVARILDIVMTETGMPASCIKISVGG